MLRVALADAERMDLVPRNVAKAAKPSALGRFERRALTPEEAKTLLSVLTGDRLESLFVLALATGLRRAELLGLRWSDVDLSGRALFVRQTLQRTDHGLVFVPPKTHRSTRPLPLSVLAVWALESQRVRQAKERLAAGEVWSDLDLVFASTIGTAMEPRNVNRRFEQWRQESTRKRKPTPPRCWLPVSEFAGAVSLNRPQPSRHYPPSLQSGAGCRVPGTSSSPNAGLS
ncbi:site-specific integrase [Micromonospora psammae]|uniref:site-specific integrase n=1 Tax=Micromonospora sp. CPCC 205556 TaxID=3122398 RepID=UPI002FEF2686